VIHNMFTIAQDPQRPDQLHASAVADIVTGTVVLRETAVVAAGNGEWYNELPKCYYYYYKLQKLGLKILSLVRNLVVAILRAPPVLALLLGTRYARGVGAVRWSTEHATKVQQVARMFTQTTTRVRMVFDVVVTNARPTGEGQRFGFFSQLARFNHACSPNCEVVYPSDGLPVEVRAIREIAVGEALTVAYAATPELVRLYFGFWCTCPGCVRPIAQATAPHTGDSVTSRTAGIIMSWAVPQLTFDQPTFLRWLKDWGFAAPCSTRFVDLLGVYTRSHPTNELYDTRDQVSPDGACMRNNEGWTTRPAHLKLLTKLANRSGYALDIVIQLDQHMHLRRAKVVRYLSTHPVDMTTQHTPCINCFVVPTFTAAPGPRTLLYYVDSHPVLGGDLSMWMDVTFSREPSSQSLWTAFAEVQEQKAAAEQLFPTNSSRPARVCSNCNVLDTVERRHKACAGCGNTYYCSRRCQGVHWRSGHRGACR
jgi:hypothetical protein